MSKNGNHKADIQHEILPESDKRPHLKRIHHSLIFWIFLFLMFVAIMYYIMSVNFAFAP